MSQSSRRCSKALGCNLTDTGAVVVAPAFQLPLARRQDDTRIVLQLLGEVHVRAFEPIGALAHLQIGRAYTIQGDTAKAKAAYQDFLTLWKDADPDIPIFIAAKAEYAKLQ